MPRRRLRRTSSPAASRNSRPDPEAARRGRRDARRDAHRAQDAAPPLRSLSWWEELAPGRLWRLGGGGGRRALDRGTGAWAGARGGCGGGDRGKKAGRERVTAAAAMLTTEQTVSSQCVLGKGALRKAEPPPTPVPVPPGAMPSIRRRPQTETGLQASPLCDARLFSRRRGFRTRARRPRRAPRRAAAGAFGGPERECALICAGRGEGVSRCVAAAPGSFRPAARNGMPRMLRKIRRVRIPACAPPGSARLAVTPGAAHSDSRPGVMTEHHRF